MYAKIENQETKECSVGVGTNITFYKSIGMVDMEVEQAYDGKWYVKGYAPTIPLDEIKATKIAELKQARDTEELSPISYGGYSWDFDEKAIQRINGAIIALGENDTITWTSADNREIKNVNVDDLKGIVGAAALRSTQLHIKYRQLREQVESATTIEEVESVVWNLSEIPTD